MGRRGSGWCGTVAGALVLLLATAVRGQQWRIEDPEQGPIALAPGAAGAHELSGLSWAGGERWAAVSDDDGGLFWLRVGVDPASGRIATAAVEGRVDLAGGRDLEGVALGDGARSVFVSDEAGPALRQYQLPDGRVMRSAVLPAVFGQLRNNLGFEALTRDEQGQLWTANEEALEVDGPTSSPEAGTLVRLLRLGANLRPTGQWAYRTDPIAGARVLPDRGTGLSGLAALPGGGLLALERSLGSQGLRIRLYEVDFGGVPEIADRPSLAEGEVMPVRKHLLWERTGLRENFEGIAVGPQLADGSRNVLLVSDDGHRLAQTLYALTLRRLKAPLSPAALLQPRGEEPSMPNTLRVAPLPESEWNDDVRQILAASQMGGRVLNIFSTLARHPDLLRRWLVFGTHVLLKSTIGARERELVILRTGWNCKAEYEWGQHVIIGKQCGLSDEEIVRITAGPDAPGWDPFDAALLRAADELHRDSRIGDATWQVLSARYDTKQMMDLVFAIGQYTLVSMALNTLGVQLDDGIPGFPAKR